jgi:hypothetical protein
MGAMHDEYKFKIIRGTAIDYKLLDIHTPIAVIRLDNISIDEYFEKVCRFGCGKHYALTYGDVSETCINIARTLKMDYLLI